MGGGGDLTWSKGAPEEFAKVVLQPRSKEGAAIHQVKKGRDGEGKACWADGTAYAKVQR